MKVSPADQFDSSGIGIGLVDNNCYEVSLHLYNVLWYKVILNIRLVSMHCKQCFLIRSGGFGCEKWLLTFLFIFHIHFILDVLALFEKYKSLHVIQALFPVNDVISRSFFWYPTCINTSLHTSINNIFLYISDCSKPMVMVECLVLSAMLVTGLDAVWSLSRCERMMLPDKLCPFSSLGMAKRWETETISRQLSLDRTDVHVKLGLYI